ncbi:hypothetical protein ACMFMF_003457 [Clarireedia jacksonii]
MALLTRQEPSYKLKMSHLGQREQLDDVHTATIFIPGHPWIKSGSVSEGILRLNVNLNFRDVAELIPIFRDILPMYTGAYITTVILYVRFQLIGKAIDMKQELSSLFRGMVETLNQFKMLSQMDIEFHLPRYTRSQIDREHYFWVLVNANHFYDLRIMDLNFCYRIGTRERVQVLIGTDLECRIRTFYTGRRRDEAIRTAKYAQIAIDAYYARVRGNQQTPT